MDQIIEFSLTFDQDIEEYLKKHYPNVKNYQILSKSLDARNAPKGRKPVFLYRILDKSKSGEDLKSTFPKKELLVKPIVVGAGPAGLFCAIRLMEYGIPCTLIDRGDRANERMKKIAKFWRYGQLDVNSNVCYGEGGAGLFSDGKLMTRVKSDLIHYVMKKLVEFGAPEHIAYESNPHLGSNKIRELISEIGKTLENFGVEFLSGEVVEKLLLENGNLKGIKTESGKEIYSSSVVLATGHSPRHIYSHLEEMGIPMSLKDFAVGVRIEHPRKYINKIQFGEFAEDPRLGSARYRASHHNKETGRGVYTFCMCPGGYVLSSGTEIEGLVTNGMSNSAHNSHWSNSALVVTTRAGVDFPDKGILSGFDFLGEIESKAKNLSDKYASGKELPAMTIKEFLEGKLDSRALPVTSCPSKIFKADISEIFPSFIVEELKSALVRIDKKWKGFAYGDALLIAPETRTSSPLRVLRDENLMSPKLSGLFPCGEGAGYAGGITSAAVDGVKVADKLVELFQLR
ncbi:MAG: NAD(P)/FAD-dependent oxidoreductase [Halobacteriovoraceae bacterium]|nr:NAD(P)/FAD-dependent oxidoreductase [Halobacteriovoraceae bacterium]MCB9093644.1 NAD(P)/FAD-dependent oxidoreductase [Halobacteriovoraceae bacterium]